MSNRLIDRLVAERDEITTTQTQILERAADENRDLEDTESSNLDDLADRARELDDRISHLNEIDRANTAAAVTRAEITTRAAEHREGPAPVTGSQARVVDEPNTYRQHGDHSFYGDLFRYQILHDPTAGERLMRHTHEMEVDGLETRDSTTTNFAGLVVPQYLTDLAAESVRQGRPFANACTRLPLPPDGMTLNVSRLTTGTNTGIQASEGATVTEATPDDTLLTVNVRTIAGQVDLSRQLLERGTGVDELLTMDLAVDYATELDRGIIADDGTSGTHLGVLSTTGHGDIDTDDATPTAAETYVEIIDALGNVATNRFMPANLIVMHPRRWAYLYGGLDTTNRPLFEPSAALAQNPVGVGTMSVDVVGAIAGVPVITDANIPTNLGAGANEDRVIVARTQDLLLWEEGDGGPRQARFEEVSSGTAGSATLQVKLVAYGYSAFTSGRQPTGVAIIQGTILTATL